MDFVVSLLEGLYKIITDIFILEFSSDIYIYMYYNTIKKTDLFEYLFYGYTLNYWL